MNSGCRWDLRRPRGFTLVELLVVMGIIALIMSLSVGVSSSWKSQKLLTEANQLASDLSHASLLAQKSNHPIELRFYLLPDEFGGGSPNAPRAFQLAQLTGYDNLGQPLHRMLSEVRLFDDDIMLAEKPAHTTVMSLPPHAPLPADPMVRGAQRSYVSFLFLPDGRTSLPRRPDAVFTLVKESQLRAGGVLPANYRAVTLQPVTGKTTAY